MNRSRINQAMREAIEFCRRMGFFLPPFAFWTPEEWAQAGHEYDEIRDCVLGWDVTKFGSSCFDETGLTLFTLRNGRDGDWRYLKSYCQKVLIIGVSQVTPCHLHFNKMEDIINCGGGQLIMQVYNSTGDCCLADTHVAVSVDGHNYSVPAGTLISLDPGSSITLTAHMYHRFWAEGGRVLANEVSKVNDDTHDNHFLDDLPRFPEIEEDKTPLHLLCNEYPPAPD